MSSHEEDFRSRRTHDARRVGVTRAGTSLGAVLTQQLRSGGHQVIGLGHAPESPSGPSAEPSWRDTDLVSPEVVDALQDLDAVVHLTHGAHLSGELAEDPGVRRSRLVREMQTLTVASAAAGVRHLVVVTSAMVYGARPDNPVPLPEDSPLRSDDTEGMVADLVEIEELLDRARDVHPAVLVTSVRPAALVGPGVDSIITRHFEAPRLLALKGARPRWQFCHVEDLGRALGTVLDERLGPVVTVGAPGSLGLEQVEEISHLRHISVAPAAAHGAADRLHRLGVLPVPASDLAYVSSPWVVDSRRLVDHGWLATHDNVDSLRVLLEEVRADRLARRVERKEAALGAAGAASAAVAIVATAALLRRRRNRT
ncbi:NAD-dependent epimerase/dehydratase family protein [Ornithinimicrobium sp. F0845]|uniref:NAD-dependent epimerase/dehydratase family protein n=1 Tax=Ornithinimicrobium sp. F0845 TaxID=2926412 RepID=UPI001FF42550|nr:NAD-dependent epimerase/dehydratase family protein [Ornithinimicrobium sp. F0845]MCK0111108.1 NAD-dependent epimerase/dehydratase family protein [Ornithinimicrobium sp. F0845]